MNRKTKQASVKVSLIKRRTRMMLNTIRDSLQSRMTKFNVMKLNRVLRQSNSRIIGL